MRHVLWILLPAVLLLAAATPSRAEPMVLPPGSTVAGRTIGEYTADWWRWALSFTAPNDPFTDPTGALANLNQSGPVFFVAGTTGGAAERTFTVPAGTHLLVPLLVGELSQLEIGFDQTPVQVRQAAREQADQIDSLLAFLNGVAVPDLFSHREVSPDFTFVAAPGNPIDVPAGFSGVAVADGYWLMLTPLEPGERLDLRFGGAASAFGFSVDVTAHITGVAVPEPSGLALAGVGAFGLLGYVWQRRKRASA